MKGFWAIALIMAFALVLAVGAGAAMADEKTIVKGIIVEYDLDESTVTIKTEDGKAMTFYIDNDVALFKLDDRLYEEDEVKIKYVVEEGKMRIKEGSDMKGTKPGC